MLVAIVVMVSCDNGESPVLPEPPAGKPLDAASEQQKKDASVTVLVLGDSLSAAYRMKESQGWVQKLARRLDNKYSVNAYQVVNASISGATTDAGLRALPNLLAQHEPRIVILQLGANDGLQGKPVEYISRNLSEMLSQIAATGASVLLVGMHLPPNYGRAYTKPFFEQYRDLSEQFDTGYLPFLLEGVATNSSLMMSDGLHPLPEAQELILENVWSQLSTLLD